MQRPSRTYIGGAVIAITVLVVLIGRQVSDGGSSSDPSSNTTQPPSRYEQTWSKPYAETTCTNWMSSMTGPQKFAASADMLVGARKVDGGAGIPGDELINEFSSGLTTACVTPMMKLTDAAVGLYLTEPRFKP